MTPLRGVKKKSVGEAKNSGSPPAELEDTLDRGMSLIYRPFLIEDKSGLQSLELAAAGSEEDAVSEVIEEREGVHYVNSEILNQDPETEKTLNRDLKTLIDSVIK
jgi:hypothetical protein